MASGSRKVWRRKAWIKAAWVPWWIGYPVEGRCVSGFAERDPYFGKPAIVTSGYCSQSVCDEGSGYLLLPLRSLPILLRRGLPSDHLFLAVYLLGAAVLHNTFCIFLRVLVYSIALYMSTSRFRNGASPNSSLLTPS